MSFSSYSFLLFFLPIIVSVYWFLNGFNLFTVSKLWLISSSLFFYYKFNGQLFYFAFFICTILFNFIIGKLICYFKSKQTKNFILFVGLATNIGSLFYFKYVNFFITILNKLFTREIKFIDVLLPLGISFFTFRVIAYIIDCSNNKAKNYSFIDFIMYMSFFPIVTMGPIVRYDDFLKQVNKSFFVFNQENFKKGLYYLSIGLSKKVLLATPLINYTNDVFKDISGVNPIIIWIAMFTNLFSFYFDFSGYSDMATGISYFFNIEIISNFNSPYKARNIQDYWKRWHISLTKFLNTYVFNYIYKPGNSVYRFCFATMVTFFVSGFWHGAGTNYILWGLVHGVCVSIAAFITITSSKKYIMPKFFARFLTMAVLLFAAALYIVDGIKNYFVLLKTLFNINNYLFEPQILLSNIYILFILILSGWICFYTKNTKQLSLELNNNKKLIVFAAMLLIISLFSISQTSTFIYQNF